MKTTGYFLAVLDELVKKRTNVPTITSFYGLNFRKLRKIINLNLNFFVSEREYSSGFWR